MAAIRFGEVPSNLRSEDVRMGKPVQRRAGHPDITVGKQTRGSETSQYPEENRTIVISLVAASEQEGAQTFSLAIKKGGCKAAAQFILEE